MHRNINADDSSSSDDSDSGTTRGKSYLAEEDRSICKAWIKISEDPEKGNNMKGDQFWLDITDEFNQTKHKNRDPRGMISLRTRWNVFCPRVNKYCGNISTVEQRNPSGTNLEDKVIYPGWLCQ